jgi:hypothetical protein
MALLYGSYRQGLSDCGSMIVVGRNAMTDTGVNSLLSKVLKDAEKKLKDNYLGATPDNCARFVRHCFADAGYALPETSHPSDLEICRANGYPLGTYFANSLAGDEIGRKLPIVEAVPGDILLFTNKGASSSFAAGTITHVGICVGDGLMIDHGETGMHRRDYRDWPGEANWAEARRPKLFDIPRTRIRLADGRVSQVLKSRKVGHLDVLVDMSGGIEADHPTAGSRLNVLVDGFRLHGFTALWLKVKDTGGVHRLSHQHGHTAASLDGRAVPALKCRMTAARGGLHIWIDDREVHASTAVIEIVHAS